MISNYHVQFENEYIQRLIGIQFHLKHQIKTTNNFEQKYLFYGRLMKLPKNSSYVRLHNRCLITGRPKGYYRDFGLCRIKLREMFHKGLLPGVSKASW